MDNHMEACYHEMKFPENLIENNRTHFQPRFLSEGADHLANKDRTLLVLKYLQDNSDGRRSVSTRDIREMLAKNGHSATVLTVRRDIRAIRDAGYDVDIQEEEGKLTRYFYTDRALNLPEAQTLVDAVVAAQFLTPAKSTAVIDMLKNIAGPGYRDDLEPHIAVSDQVKAENEMILLYIQDICKAIHHKRKISFLYMTEDPEQGRIPKHEGYVYFVSPYATVWKEDRYYLIGWSEKHGRVAVFRIDRIDRLKIEKQRLKNPPEDYSLQDYLDKAFRMYGNGEEETVTLRFPADKLDQIQDRFGRRVEVTQNEDGTYQVTVDVILSGTFFGWLHQYVGEITLAAPETARQQYAKRLREALKEMKGK